MICQKMASGGKTSLSLSVQQLIENTPEDFERASSLLLKFANNLVLNPDDPKYRKIRLANATVQNQLLPICGAMECLFEMGFQEDGEFLNFPMSQSLGEITVIRDELLQELKNRGLVPNNSKSGENVAGPKIHSAPAGKVIRPQPQQKDLLASQFTFFNKLKTSFDHVLMYEDKNLQTKARNVIPCSQLEGSAEKKYDELTQGDNKGENLYKADLLLLELLQWFKHDFFKWVDAPQCDGCKGKTTAKGMASPTPAEITYGAGRVENYFCEKCQVFTRFPRYNHPGILLETRKGRCGEWANCFTLCCRAMGFEARYVLDWTDHVWTEVYSQGQKRWLHCDPCENVCDKPLLYEAGWGKKLTYVIAFSVDDIQDVTWRYSGKHDEILSRRHECDEKWLVGNIVRMRNQRQNSAGDARRKILQERLIAEIIDLLTVKAVGEEELQGRSTGSMEWRKARGELGTEQPESSYIIRLTEKETADKIIHIKYCCATNEYIRLSNYDAVTKGWQALTSSETKNINRKEEQDWKMVYLARKEGTPTASISWQFDLSGSGLMIDSVDIEAKSDCYEDGQILWRLCSKDSCAMLPPGGQKTTFKDDFNGCETLSVTADLRRGKGDCAWQHTQLFRQSMNDNNYPFEIKIRLKQQ